MKIAHLTSAHSRYDIRIFLKECRSLADAGHDTHLVVADGKGNEVKDGVHILDAGASTSRLSRMMSSTRRVLSQAIALNCDVYHLHDPELLPAGLSLRAKGKMVIFDAHEDLPKQIRSKEYLPPRVRVPLSFAVKHAEGWAFRGMSGLISATPAIGEKLRRLNTRSETINNYPLPGELASVASDIPKLNEICYVGGVSKIRGCTQLIQAMALVGHHTRLNLAGPVQDKGLQAVLSQEPGWDAVNSLGVISREGVRNVMARSFAGIVTFLPVPNHIEAQPNKMFEYMSAGLPVIGSNFPRWREIIEGVGCGICVDPADPVQIANAIHYLCDNRQQAAAMGENGRRAVETRFNWPAEARKLINFYETLQKVSH